MPPKSTPSIKDRIKAATLPEQVVFIPLDRALAGQLQILEDELTQAQARRQADARFKADVRKAAEKVVAKRDEIQASVVRFTIRGLPADEWRDLKAEHPADPKSTLFIDPMIGANSQTLLDAALPKCTVDPQMDDEDWASLRATLSGGDWDKLREAVIAVNEDGTSVPFVPNALKALGVSDDASK